MRRALLAVAAVAGCGRIGFVALPGDDVTGDGRRMDVSIPPNTNIAFVLSSDIMPMSLGGLAGADMICNDHAHGAGLPGTYVAWLSTASVNARDRLGSARGWVRVDGRPFADTVASLLGGTIYYPLSVDEKGQTVDQTIEAVTGSHADGTYNGGDCGGYTSLSGTVGVGVPRFGHTVWTENGTPLSRCGLGFRLYCFGIDHVTAVQPMPSNARRAFLSAMPWLPGAGPAAADTVCKNEATAASLTGMFAALVGRVGSTAIARFSLTSSVWTRVDGVALADTTADFAAGNSIAPLDVTAGGLYAAPEVASAWTGGLPNATGTAATTCADWSIGTTAGNAHGGNWNSSSTGAFEQVVALPCDETTNRLYCLEL